MFSEDATPFFPTLDFRTGERAVMHEGFDYHGPDVPFKGVRAFLHDFAMEQPRAELRPSGGYRVIVTEETLAEFMRDALLDQLRAVEGPWTAALCAGCGGDAMTLDKRGLCSECRR